MTILHSPIRILGFGSPIMGNDGVGLKVIEILKKKSLKSLKVLTSKMQESAGLIC